MLNNKNGLIIKCSHGISGDMTVGALLSLGANPEKLLESLAALNVDGFHIEITQIKKHGLTVHDYDVIIELNPTQTPNPRNLSAIFDLLDAAPLTRRDRDLSKDIFQIAATAGSKAHKVPIEQFTFHEAGALDSIADIVGMAVCLNDLVDQYQVESLFISELVDGYGPIQIRDRQLPVPVPAVKSIITDYELPYRNSDVFGELVTPTGAAFAALVHSRQDSALPENYEVLKVGYGNGKRQNDSKSILQMELIEW